MMKMFNVYQWKKCDSLFPGSARDTKSSSTPTPTLPQSWCPTKHQNQNNCKKNYHTINMICSGLYHYYYSYYYYYHYYYYYRFLSLLLSLIAAASPGEPRLNFPCCSRPASPRETVPGFSGHHHLHHYHSTLVAQFCCQNFCIFRLIKGICYLFRCLEGVKRTLF